MTIKSYKISKSGRAILIKFIEDNCWYHLPISLCSLEDFEQLVETGLSFEWEEWQPGKWKKIISVEINGELVKKKTHRPVPKYNDILKEVKNHAEENGSFEKKKGRLIYFKDIDTNYFIRPRTYYSRYIDQDAPKRIKRKRKYKKPSTKNDYEKVKYIDTNDWSDF